MARTLGDEVVVSLDAHLAEEGGQDERTSPHGSEFRVRLIGAVDLIDALLEHGFEELATRRKQGIAEHLLPWEQAGGLGLLQEWHHESLDFFLQCRL